MVESLPSMSETLNSPIAAKKQNKKASKQETQQKFYFNNVLTSFYQPDRIKLKSLGKKDPQLRVASTELACGYVCRGIFLSSD